MRKTLSLILVFCVICTIAYAGVMYRAVGGLTGGSPALDGIVSPSVGDQAIVYTDATSTTDATFLLYYAVSGTRPESAPKYILPNTNANNVTWSRVEKFFGLVSTPSGTGILIVSNGTSSLITANTNNGLFGTDGSGNMGLFTDLLFSGLAITGDPVQAKYGGTGADTSAWSGLIYVSGGTYTVISETTCTTGKFINSITSSGITCTAP